VFGHSDSHLNVSVKGVLYLKFRLPPPRKWGNLCYKGQMVNDIWGNNGCLFCVGKMWVRIINVCFNEFKMSSKP
jgi:hypothetical protein